MKFSKRTTSSDKPRLNVSLEIVVSLLLFLAAFAFSLCLGQKAYDTPEETGFYLSYWIPGVVGMLTIIDVGIIYIDNKKDSLWSKIVLIVVSIGELVVCVIAGHDYFTKYTLTGPDSAFRYIARALISLVVVLNIALRTLKFFPKITSKLDKNCLLAVFSTLTATSLLSMGYAALDQFIKDSSLDAADNSLFMVAFIISCVAIIVSIASIFLKESDLKKYINIATTLMPAVVTLIAVLAFIVIREFGPGEYKADYWSLICGGASIVASLMAFVICALSLKRNK